MTPCNPDLDTIRAVMAEMGMGDMIFRSTHKYRSRKSALRAMLYRRLIDRGMCANRIAIALGYSHPTILYTLQRHTESVKPRPELLPTLAAIEARVLARFKSYKWGGLWERTWYVGLRRSPQLVCARRVVFRHLRRHGFSYPEIAAVTTGRGHTTVLESLKPKTVRAFQSRDRIERKQRRKFEVCA